MQYKHLFVLTAPYSGSTLLVSLLGTSPKVSILPTRQHEGMKLPGLREMFWSEPGSRHYPLPWAYLEQIYRRHWDLSRPVLVEKGQYLRNAWSIQDAFPEAHFICMQRDPYAWCESVRRRRKPTARDRSLTELASRWAEQAAWLMHDMRTLKHALHFGYEDLCDRTGEVLGRLKVFMPELDGMEPSGSFQVHSGLGHKSNAITNTNEAAIARLSGADMAEISAVLSQHPDLLESCGYSLR
jgi:hypothetical protein